MPRVCVVFALLRSHLDEPVLQAGSFFLPIIAKALIHFIYFYYKQGQPCSNLTHARHLRGPPWGVVLHSEWQSRDIIRREQAKFVN